MILEILVTLIINLGSVVPMFEELISLCHRFPKLRSLAENLFGRASYLHTGALVGL